MLPEPIGLGHLATMQIYKEAGSTEHGGNNFLINMQSLSLSLLRDIFLMPFFNFLKKVFNFKKSFKTIVTPSKRLG